MAIIFPAIAFSQDKEKNFKLSGNIKGFSNPVEWVYIQYRVKGEWKTDSVTPKSGSYKFEGAIEEPVLARLRVKYAEVDGKRLALSAKRDVLPVFLQPGKIKVSSVDSFTNATVSGSLAHDEYTKLQAQVKPYNDKMEPLYGLYTHFSKTKENSARDKVEAVIDSLDNLRNEKVYGEYVKNNTSSPLSLYALQQFAGWNIDADKVEPVFNALAPAIQNYPSAIEFKTNLEIAKKTGIGKMAMDFTQDDTLGKPVSLSSLRGRYLLIDFWASWCGPCRAENPNVVKVFNKYKDKGFHIIGVSLDRPGQKEKWLKAIHDDELAWTQVSDLKFWDNEVAKQYGIRAIPQNLLLDPEGKIIAKNVRGEELDQKVGDAIEGKKAF